MAQPRLKTKYIEEIRPALKQELEIANEMLIPKIEKVTISVGTGFALKSKDSKATKDVKLIQNVADTISTIAGQKAVIVEAKKSVAGFKVREGMPTGIKVTLRNKNMFVFLDKLISIALPRVKDFRGIARNGFDGRGNFNFGLTEQLIFPEVEYDDIVRIHGMNINIATSTQSDKEAFLLLEKLGLPFTKAKNNG
jgi:large subunit ribosomal protein L5